MVESELGLMIDQPSEEGARKCQIFCPNPFVYRMDAR